MVKTTGFPYIEDMALKMDATREHIVEFLRNRNVAILATADQDGAPHAATVFTICDADLTFFFITKQNTQKGRNLAVNPRASIAIYDTQSLTTVQGDGVVIEVTNSKEVKDIFAKLELVARLSSESGVNPPSEVEKGGYVTYRLSLPGVRMIQYGQSDAGINSGVFDAIV